VHIALHFLFATARLGFLHKTAKNEKYFKKVLDKRGVW
jgi:hypothetical protein